MRTRLASRKGQGEAAVREHFPAATILRPSIVFGPEDQFFNKFAAMARILPASAIETAALAIELEALSEDLDRRLARALSAGPITEATYADAYRSSSTRGERERQVELIGEVGRRLDALVKKPLVFGTLKLMRRPARLAGLADLQDFLERGFDAFRAMRGAEPFIELVRERETAILNRLFSGAAEPFSL